jgi:hypothetical protein
VSTDNVGIGIDNPDGPLHLVLPATSNYTGFTYQSGDVKTVFGNTGDDSTNTSFVQVYSGVSSSVPDTNSGTYHLALQPHGGNVGIGTTSPNNSLHIYKNANERTSGLFIEKAEGGTNAAALFFGVNAPGENPGVAKAAIFYERNLVNGRGDLKFCNDASSDANNVSPETADTRMIIKNNGNVGIGTADPGSILDVHGASGASIKKTAPTASTGTYNYILNGPRPGTTSGGAVHFINGSVRSTDGGVSTYTMRNDSGNTRVGYSPYTTIIAGAHSFPNRPIAVVGKNNLGQAGQGSGVFVFNTALINSGIYNYSNGRFTAPSGYGGYYLLSFTGIGAYYNTNAPNTRWYTNGYEHHYGAYHTNLGGMSGTPAHVGISGMHILNLAAGHFVDLRIVGGTLYGQSTLHAYAVCLYLGAA